MTALPDDPDAIFHLTTPAEWAAARDSGEVVPAGFAEEGFVHCSTGRQLASTIDRHFAGHDELVLLRLRADAVQATSVGRRAGPGRTSRTCTGRWSSATWTRRSAGVAPEHDRAPAPLRRPLDLGAAGVGRHHRVELFVEHAAERHHATGPAGGDFPAQWDPKLGIHVT